MPKTRLLIYAFVLAALAAVLLVRNSRREAPSAMPVLAGQPAPAKANAPESPAADEALGTRVVPSDSAADGPPELPDGAIPNEFVLSFQDEEAYERFLADAELRGLPVRGRLDSLRMVRMGMALEAFWNQLPEGADWGFNYRVEAPPLPKDEVVMSGGIQGFGNTALRFLGITQVDGNWGQGVMVAVVDTGIQPHRSLEHVNIRYINLAEADISPALSGHATAMASLIAGRGDGLTTGLAQSVDLLSVRVLDGSGQGDAFTLAQGIVTAVDAGAQIVNLSLGTYGNSNAVRAAVDYALEHGVTLVSAVGNDGRGRITFPAAYDEVIGVTAVDANRHVPSFANQGQGVNLAAPGVGMYTAWSDESYVVFDGTSSAAPLVSATAALLYASDPNMTPAQVSQILLELSDDAGAPGVDGSFGSGILNVERVLERDVSGIRDIAVADHYVDSVHSDASNVPVLITFQNRGTEFLPGANVEIVMSGQDYIYRLDGMNPGEVRTVQLPIHPSSLQRPDGVLIESSVELPAGLEDSRPKNNEKKTQIRLVPAGEG